MDRAGDPGYEVEIGELRPEEHTAASALVGRAMRDLPSTLYIWGPDPTRRVRGMEALMAAVMPAFRATPICARHQGVLVGLCCAAPPGTCVPRPAESLRVLPALLRQGPGTFVRMNRYFSGNFRHDPRRRHWHIGPVAVEPAVQGMGVGGRMMAELAGRLDERGEMGHLETDRAENVPFYEAAGFTVTLEMEVAGIRSWFMDREPR